MVSFLLTAWKEPDTIAKAIARLTDPEFSGFSGEFELLLVAPDKETAQAARKEVERQGISEHYRYFEDAGEGKPRALNILFKEAKGDILILTDGEVFFNENAVKHLIETLESDSELGGVSGRPIATNPKDTKMGYWAHLQADAVHQMRSDNNASATRFFPLSGYIMAVRNLGFEFPEDLYLDDAYLSYDVFNKGYKIGYAKDAQVEVKYPTNWEDFISQKFRSLIGFEQLWKYDIIRPETKSRSFWQELRYSWFPISYSHNLRELFWSISYFPVRLYLWVKNRLSRDLAYKGKSIRDVYVRTESTK